jgi:feruloyl-CoA synthase
MIATAPVMPVPARTLLRRGPNGTLLYGSRQALPDGAARVTDWLAGWARATPDAIFLAERRSATDRRWREMTYAEAWQGACAVATGLLAAGHGAARPAMVLAPNGLDHAVLALGTMLAGIPYAPVTPMLAAEGADPARLRHVLALLRPSLIFVADAAAAPGLRGQSLEGAELVVGAEGLAALRGDAAPPPPAAPDAVSKILLTSGSTGAPKAVICTHRGMATNMRMTIAAWPFLGRQRPVLTCWLPWNHAFGGNHHFHTVLALGGTLRIDDSLGRPALFDRLIENLAEVPPTFFGAVPAGFAALLPVLERDAAFRARFFGRLDALFSAGAAMPQETWDRLHAAGAAARGAPVPVLAGWGATECGPGATLVQGRAASPADIGTPLPGVEIKLAPVADKLELRVRSPSVTPGYWGDPARTEAAFDAQGYFRTGDAGRFADPGDPDAGLVFDGRIAEDFKLASGTWVSVGPLRLALLRAAARR